MRDEYNKAIKCVLSTRLHLTPNTYDIEELDRIITLESSNSFIPVSISASPSVLDSTSSLLITMTNSASTTRRAIFETLLSALVSILNATSTADILFWKRTVQMYSRIVIACMQCPNVEFQQSLIIALFKHSYLKDIMKCFLKLIPSVQSEMRMGTEGRRNAVEVLKLIQPPNRYIQHACSHLKVKAADFAATKNIPVIKADLEKIIFAVQRVIRQHGLQDAFSCGQLKARDIQGNEIESQTFIGDENDENVDSSAKMNEKMDDCQAEKFSPFDT
ncbi:hypothetical protein ACOME3_001384 [Neoechinorhynchus agilis]